MWKDVCHKCKIPVWNGIPTEIVEKGSESVSEFENKMKSDGYVLGYDTKSVGTWGNWKEVSIKPICKNCKHEEENKNHEKETNKAIRKISKIIKKEFYCPICMKSLKSGYNTDVFKCSTRKEMIDHIKEKHVLTEIKDVIPRDDY